jgi:hypothetical protein
MLPSDDCTATAFPEEMLLGPTAEVVTTPFDPKVESKMPFEL